MTGPPTNEAPLEVPAATAPLSVAWVGDATVVDRYISRRTSHIRITQCGGSDMSGLLHQAASNDPPPDVLVIDSTLPVVDPLQVLDIVKSHGLDLPVILLTPPSGKDEVLLKIGRLAVCDCVVKTEDFVYQMLPAIAQVRARHDLQAVFRATRDSEENVRQILETQPAVVFILDEDTRVTAMNRAGLALLSFRGDQVIGERFTAFVPEDERPALAELIGRVCAGEPGELHHSIAVANGQVRSVRTHVVPLPRPKGNVALATLVPVVQGGAGDDLSSEIERLSRAVAEARAEADAIRAAGEAAESRLTEARQAADEAYVTLVEQRDEQARLVLALDARVRELEGELVQAAQAYQSASSERDAFAERERRLQEESAQRERALQEAVADLERRLQEASDQALRTAAERESRERILQEEFAAREGALQDTAADLEQRLQATSDQARGLQEERDGRERVLQEELAVRERALQDTIADLERRLQATSDQERGLEEERDSRERVLKEQSGARERTLQEAVADLERRLQEASDRARGLAEERDNREHALHAEFAARERTLQQQFEDRERSLLETLASKEQLLSQEFTGKEQALTDALREAETRHAHAVTTMVDLQADRDARSAELADLRTQWSAASAECAHLSSELAAVRSHAEALARRGDTDRDAIVERERALQQELAERERTLLEDLATRELALSEAAAAKEGTIVEALRELEARHTRAASTLVDLETTRERLVAELTDARTLSSGLSAECVRLSNELDAARRQVEEALSRSELDRHAMAEREDTLRNELAGLERALRAELADRERDLIADLAAREQTLNDALSTKDRDLSDIRAQCESFIADCASLTSELEAARSRVDALTARSEHAAEEEKRDLFELRELLIDVLFEADQRYRTPRGQRQSAPGEAEDPRPQSFLSFPHGGRVRPASGGRDR